MDRKKLVYIAIGGYFQSFGFESNKCCDIASRKNLCENHPSLKMVFFNFDPFVPKGTLIAAKKLEEVKVNKKDG